MSFVREAISSVSFMNEIWETKYDGVKLTKKYRQGGYVRMKVITHIIIRVK